MRTVHVTRIRPGCLSGGFKRRDGERAPRGRLGATHGWVWIVGEGMDGG